MVTAALVGEQAESAPHIGLAGAGAAKVNEGGQILLLPEGRGRPAGPGGTGNRSIEEGRGQLDRMGR